MPKPTSNTPSQGNAAFDGGQFISELLSGHFSPVRVGQLFQKLGSYVNGLAANSANSGSGEIAPPPPVAGLNLSVPTVGELVHVAHDHPGPVQRGVQYFTEIGFSTGSVKPNFSQPLVIDHGASRTAHPFSLPTMDASGNTYNYVARGFAQYHGSKRSGDAYYGTAQSPTVFNVAGTSRTTLQPSNGSGTASNRGTQGGQGLGDTLFRAAPGPKRNTGSV